MLQESTEFKMAQAFEASKIEKALLKIKKKIQRTFQFFQIFSKWTLHRKSS
jgi:hypothetical protein